MDAAVRAVQVVHEHAAALPRQDHRALLRQVHVGSLRLCALRSPAQPRAVRAQQRVPQHGGRRHSVRHRRRRLRARSPVGCVRSRARAVWRICARADLAYTGTNGILCDVPSMTCVAGACAERAGARANTDPVCVALQIVGAASPTVTHDLYNVDFHHVHAVRAHARAPVASCEEGPPRRRPQRAGAALVPLPGCFVASVSVSKGTKPLYSNRQASPGPRVRLRGQRVTACPVQRARGVHPPRRQRAGDARGHAARAHQAGARRVRRGRAPFRPLCVPCAACRVGAAAVRAPSLRRCSA